MAEIKRSGDRTIIDYMARDYDSLLLAMRVLIPDKLPEWTEFTSEADFGNVLLQLFAHMGDILSYYQDRIANESFLGTAQTRRSIIHHLNLIGYKLATGAPAAASLTITVPATVGSVVTIEQGDAFATKSQKDKPSVRFEYTRQSPLTINFGPITAVGGKKSYTGIPVEEGRLVKDELLGVSDGTPNQRYPLGHPGLILRSLVQATQINKDLVVNVQLPGGPNEEWTLQESLAFSGEQQTDFVVEIDEVDRATISFGDGNFGKIPASGATIRATYRVGGGIKGNVAANTIQTIVDAPQLALLGAKVTNNSAATGGADRESIEHAVQQAPAVFRSLRRAVTADDYKALALRFKGVGKVRAEPAGWNRVKLFVAPEGGGQVSDVLEANLLAYFEDKRPISTLIEVEDVDYVPILVRAEQLGVQSYYAREDVKARVRAAVSQLLAFERVDFGQTLYLSKFFEAIEAVEGVDFVTIAEFQRGDPAVPADDPPHHDIITANGIITLGINELPMIPAGEFYAGGIALPNVTGGY